MRVLPVRDGALEHALVTVVRPDLVGRLPNGAMSPFGVVGWGALVAVALQRGQPPASNRTAWARVGLEALASSLH